MAFFVCFLGFLLSKMSSITELMKIIVSCIHQCKVFWKAASLTSYFVLNLSGTKFSKNFSNCTSILHHYLLSQDGLWYISITEARLLLNRHKFLPSWSGLVRIPGPHDSFLLLHYNFRGPFTIMIVLICSFIHFLHIVPVC